jgi:hypothetical protein
MLVAQKTDTQTTGKEDSEVSPCSYNHLILDQDGKNICWRTTNGYLVSQQMVLGN